MKESHEGEEADPNLLQLALRNVAEALGTLNMTPEEVKQHQEILEKILSYPGSLAIYSLGSWLKSLGLKLTVTLAESAKEQIKNPAPDETYSQPEVDLATETTPSTVSR